MATLDSTKIFGDLDVNGNFRLSGSNLFNGNIRNSFGELGVKIGLSEGDDPQIQLQGDGTNVNPHIDFANGLNQDYDARIILEGDNLLSVLGAEFKIKDADLVASGNMRLSGDLKMVGSDSYIWTPDTANGYTGFWDPHNNKALMHVTNESGGHIQMKAPFVWKGDQDYQGLYWGELHKDGSAHSAAWGYIRQGATAGQLELGSDDKIDFYETDERKVAVSISTNNKSLDAKGWLAENGVKLQDKYLGKTAKAVDADKLDGLNSSDFLRTNHLSGRVATDANALDNQGVRFDFLNSSAVNDPTGTDHAIMTMAHSTPWAVQLAGDWRTNKWYVRGQNNNTWSAWDELLKLSEAESKYVRKNASSSFTTLTGDVLNANTLGIRNTSNSTGKGLSLYGGASSGKPTYGMMFAGTASFGKHGGVQSDWATYFTMSDTTNRGWIFQRGTSNVASIDGSGNGWFAAVRENGTLLTDKYLGKTAKAADADKIDGNDISQLFRRIDNTSDYKATANIMCTQEFANKLPVGLTGAYTYGGLMTINDGNSRLRIYTPHQQGTDKSAMYFATGWGSDNTPKWERVMTYADGDAKYLGKTAKAADSEKVDGINGASLLRSDANDSFSGDLVSTNRSKGIFGVYDSHKTDQIWSMGTAYRNASDGSNFGNLYGLAYKHTNNTTGGNMAGGHQMVWCTNGNPKAAMGDSGIWTNGTIWEGGTALSSKYLGKTAKAADSDKLDGLNSTDFSRSNHTHSGYAASSHNHNIAYHDANNYIDIKDHSGHTWFRNSDATWTFQSGTAGDDWTQTFALYLPTATTDNAQWAEIGQRQSNATHGRYKGLRVVYYVNGAKHNGYLEAGETRITGNLEINKDAPTIRLRDTNNKTAFLHNNSNIMYILRSSGNNGTTWDSGPNGRHPMTLYLDNGNVVFSGNVTAYSDENLKEQIKVIESPLEKITQIRGVTYHWKNDEANVGRQVGVIAQEVQKVLPEVVTKDQDSGNLTVAYSNMVGLLIEGTKELNSKVESQEEIIKNQQSEIDELKEMVKLLASKVGL